MKIDDKRFNKWFSAFMLIGMTVALVLTTAIKLGRPDARPAMLLFAAFGSLMGVCATVASANGKIITFLFGLLDVAIYGIMCMISWHEGSSGLGNAILHFAYFVPMQFVGFAQWRKRGAKGGEKPKARRLKGKQWALYTSIMIVGTIVAYLIIARFDKSQAESFLKMAVLLDVVPVMFNILGQLLMSTAYVEQWFFWIGVNIFSIIMWSRTLAQSPGNDYAIIYIIKYSFYLVNAINGLRIWIGMSRDAAEKPAEEKLQ